MGRSMIGGSKGAMKLGVITVLLLASACARVSRDEFHEGLDQVRSELRTEIREGDEAVERRVNQRVDEMETRMTNLERSLNDLRDEFNVTVERLEAAIRFNAPVHFAFDDATVRSEDRELLDRFAEAVRSYYSEATITVEGFTDSAGSAQYNMRLGQRRAEAVADYLSGRGLPADRMRAVSYGQAQERQIVPGAQGPGGEGWQNRRVSMVIDFNPAATRAPVAMAGEGEG